MRLKKLKVHGFKSFAGEVHLDFEADVIGLIGPNGCGKSNIVDAFRWVLGEQSAKSMRAGQMNDVIFAGSSTRKPLNYAEVSLTLAEVEGFGDVTVTRRLYRSGDSEYLINRENVRLKDIQNLFLGSGVGRKAFSIFEQGKLDEIIHLSPLDRRSLFDEAAGIGKFLQNKKEASKHLAEVAGNYERIKDLHHEIDKRRKQLKKQAGDALIHQENKRALEQLEISILIAKWKKLFQNAESWEGQRKSLGSELEQEKGHFADLERRFEEGVKQIQAQEKEVRSLEEKVYSTASTVKIKNAEEKREKERAVEFETRIKKVRQEKEGLEKEKKPLAEELKETSTQHQKLEERRSKREKVRADLQEKYAGAENDLKAIREQEKQSRNKEMELSLQRGLKEKEESQKKERITNWNEELKNFDRGSKENEKSLSGLEQEEQKRRAQVKKEISQIDIYKDEISSLEKQIVEQKKRRSLCEKELAEAISSVQEAKAVQKAQIALLEECEGFSSGSKFLLKESKNPKSALYNKLKPFYEEITLPAFHEKSVGLSLSRFASTLVVKSKDDLSEVLAVAIQKKLGDFSIVTQEKAKKIKTFFTKEMTLEKTVAELCEKLSESASQDGFYVDGFGVLYCAPESEKETNAIFREIKIKELQHAIVLLEEKREELAVELGKCTEKVSALEKLRGESDEKRRKCEMQLVQENFYLQQALAGIKKMKEEIVGQAKEKLRHEEKIKEERASLERLGLEIARIKEEERKAKEGAIGAEKLLKEKSVAFETLFETKKREDEEYFALSSDVRSLKEKCNVLTSKTIEREAREKKIASELEELLTRANASKEKAAQLSQEGQAVVEEHNVANDSHQNQSKDLREKKRELDALEKVLQGARKKMEALNLQEHKLELSFAQNIAARTPLAEELASRFSIDVEKVDVEKYPLQASLEESEKSLQKLRHDLEKGSLVNLASIEEAKVEEERFSAIDKQLADLKATKDDIEKIVAKLDGESRKSFKTTFEQIRKNFQKNFSLFFNGGSADLKFTDSQDILEAGVEIFAEPPGKQMRTISLLSGGEKCMTALALLFSIFEVKPAPFCILDEVDAPLDDANVERFTNVMKQFTPHTQFIIVTHNKKTMAIADLLFGVSMEEKGVSKLISLIFEKRQLVSVK